MYRVLWIQWTTTVVMKPVGLVTRSIVIPERETRDEPFMTVQFLSPHSDAYEAAVDEAIATCDGNLPGSAQSLDRCK